MALVSMRQLLDHAAENGYGIPAFNINNLEQAQDRAGGKHGNKGDEAAITAIKMADFSAQI